MVSKADYLAAARRLHGQTRPTQHAEMGLNAHKYMTSKIDKHALTPHEMKRLVSLANDLAKTRLRKKKPNIKRKITRR